MIMRVQCAVHGMVLISKQDEYRHHTIHQHLLILENSLTTRKVNAPSSHIQNRKTQPSTLASDSPVTCKITKPSVKG